jgi:pyruvate ferredoxin oxidoreductase beta subunit
VSRLKRLARRDAGMPPLRGGHSLCQGCGIPMVVRTVLDSIETPVVVVSATGCLEVATTRYPTTAWNVPWLHVAFENAAAAASGVESAYRALRRRGGLPQEDELTIVAFAGDGGTYDIGLQALSGALERGHRFVFVCYDNQAYMNTGIQRSGATPFGAATTTTPAGAGSLGKLQQRKDMTAIAAAHHVPYVAQAAAGPHWQDLSMKAARAAKADGPAFLNVLADCPLGWGHEARLSPSIVNGAVESRVWPLYEVDEGRYRLTYQPTQTIPVADWLRTQKRFEHLFRPDAAELLEEIQQRVDQDWTALLARCAMEEGDASPAVDQGVRRRNVSAPASSAAPVRASTTATSTATLAP